MSYFQMIGWASDARQLRRTTEAQSVQLADLARELTELREQLSNMQLVNRAYIEVIAEKIGLEPGHVETRLKELVEEESVAQPCNHCNRPLPKGGLQCIYCGEAVTG